MLSMLPRCRDRLRELSEVPIEARTQRTPLRSIGPCAREHHEVHGRQRTMLAKRFASKAFEFVAIHSASRDSA